VIAAILRAKDAFTPADLARVLKEVFKSSEKHGADFVFLPGWEGLPGEHAPEGTNGPGDFKSIFDPANNPNINRFDGFGTSRKTGQR
jgi:hypothetical protein